MSNLDANNCTFPGIGTFGSLAVTGVTPTAIDYAALSSDDLILVTVSGKNITLPTAVGAKGKRFTVKLTVTGSATVVTTSAQTIDGAATCFLNGQWSFVTVVSDDSNWLIIGLGGSTLDPSYVDLY